MDGTYWRSSLFDSPAKVYKDRFTFGIYESGGHALSIFQQKFFAEVVEFLLCFGIVCRAFDLILFQRAWKSYN